MERLYYERKLKSALLFFSLALIFLIGFVLFSRQSERKPDGIESIIPDNFGMISEISCSSSESLVLRRSGEGWKCVNCSLPVDGDRIEELSSLLSEMESIRVLENALDYYDTFGFNTPTCILTVVSDIGEIRLRIGMYNIGIDAFYLINDSMPERVYLVREKYVLPFLLNKADIVPGIEKEFPAARDVFTIELSSQEADYALKRTDTMNELLYSSSYKWAVDVMSSKPFPGYDTRISAFLDNLLSLGKCDRVSYHENGGAIASTGLSGNSRIVLTYSCESGIKSTQLVFSEPEADGSAYFSDNNDRLLYHIDANKYTAIAKHLKSSYVTAKYLCLFAPEEIEKVCMHGNSVNCELIVTHDDDAKYVLSGGKTADTEKAEAFLSKLHSLPSEGYLPHENLKMPEHIADSLEIIITTFRGEVKLTLEMYDYNFYIAKIDAVDNALISKVNVSELKQLAAALCA